MTIAVHRCPSRCPAPSAITAIVLDAHVEPIALSELASGSSVTASEGDGVERAHGQLTRAQSELAAYVEAVSTADVGVEAFAAGAQPTRRGGRRSRDDADRAGAPSGAPCRGYRRGGVGDA